jgi:sugar phosphate isomerase/epimerase
LILSSHTVRGVGIEVRAQAAAAAGFTGTGAHHEDLARARADGVALERLAEMVAVAGVPVVEVGFLHRWTEPEPDAAEERRQLFGLARLLGASRVNAGLYTGPDRATIARRFGELCWAAADAGLGVALEFFPFGALPTPGIAMEVLLSSGVVNATLLFDVWHFHRAGAPALELATIPAGSISCLQIADASRLPEPDVGEESRHGRLLPGEGVIDLVGLLRRLAAAGHRPPVAVEVLSDRLDQEGPMRAAALAARAASRVLDEAGWR